MADKLEHNDNPKNYVELTESQIFEKAKEDLIPIQENLSEKKITINQAKDELKKINERLQSTKLEQRDKKDIWKAFEKLINLEKNIDENTIQNEVNEIINLLETLIQRELTELKYNITRWNWTQNRPIEVQKWIEQSSNNLKKTAESAKNDKNRIAKKMWERIEKLMS